MALGGRYLRRKAAYKVMRYFLFGIVPWTADHCVDSKFVFLWGRHRHFVKPGVSVLRALSQVKISKSGFAVSLIAHHGVES